MAEHLSADGCNVYRFDLRGHGKSEGIQGHVNDYQEYLDDLVLLLDTVKEENPTVPTVLLGHSMGGFLAALYGIRYPDGVDGIVLSGAATKYPKQANAAMRPIIGIMGTVFPQMKMKNTLGNVVSKDPDVVAKYNTDPLNRSAVTMGLYKQFLLRGVGEVMNGAEQFRSPVLILHGGSDAIVDCSASREFYDRISSQDRTLHIYEGLYHEIFNEPEQGDVFADLLAWVDERF
jgi:alpha-beta hydrolase superfamily lysophospholipase